MRVVRKYNKQTLCGWGSDLGRKGVAQSFPGSCTGGDPLSPALLTLAHALPNFGWSPVLWHNPHFPSQPSAQVPSHSPGVAQLLWCKEASLSVGNGLLGT